MATRIEDILLRARDILADPDAERWTDDRLIRLIDEGQRDIAHQTRLLRGEVEIPLIIGQANYTLPDDVFLILRAGYDDCQVPFTTYDQMDELARTEVASDYRHYSDSERRRGYSSSSFDRRVCWENAEGNEPQYIIYDKNNLQEIRVYPIPDEGIVDDLYTFTTDNPDFAGAELLGVVVDAEDYTFDQYNGVVVDLFDPQISIEVEDGSVPYGIVTDAFEYSANLKIWYVRTTKTISSINDELEIPTMFDVAIKHYVVWQAFRDDFDTRFMEKAEGARMMYLRDLEIVDDVASKNAVRMPQRRTSYRGAFE